MAIRMNGLFGSRVDAARFITNLNQMIRGFVAGNLVVGSVMAAATTLVLWGVGMKGAIPLGIASGLLNLLPFLGLIASLALPLAAALLQFNTPGPFIKLVADLHPSLCHLSNMLALTPRPTARWVRYGETALERAIPSLRPRPGKVPVARKP